MAQGLSESEAGGVSWRLGRPRRVEAPGAAGAVVDVGDVGWRW